MVYRSAGDSGAAGSEVPADRIPLVLAALGEATVDPDPAEWVVLGDLHCLTRSGTQLDIDLFFVDQNELALRTDGRHYFRGVSAVKLAELIPAAKLAPQTRPKKWPEG